MSRPARLAMWLVGSAATCMLIFWIGALVFPAAFDYGEGDTATWIALLRHGQPIYGVLDGLPMQFSNYPPLHLHLVASLAPSDAAILPIARALALFGVLLASGMVGWAVWMPTRSRRAAIGAAVLFAITLRVGYYGVTARADALALGLGALAMMIGIRQVRGWAVWCALLFSASALSKHSLICFPLGFTFWALRRKPWHGLLMGGLTASIVGMCMVAFGLEGPLLVWSRAPWDLSTWWFQFWTSVLPSVAGLVIAGRVVFRWSSLSMRARIILEPWVAVFFVGVVWTFALGRMGASSNYLLELIAATTVIAVVAVEEGLFRRLFNLHLFFTWLETVIWVGFLLFRVLPEARLEQQVAARALAGVQGPVFAEQTWQATSVGHPPVVIPFLSTQLAQSGHWNPAPLVDLLRHGGVERVLLNFPLSSHVEEDPRHYCGRFFPDELTAMRDRYREVAHAGQLWVYAPR
jgi:hypothetical protein